MINPTNEKTRRSISGAAGFGLYLE